MMRTRRRDPLHDVNLLGLIPVRTANWTERADRVVIERPRPQSHGIRQVGRRIAHWLAPARLRLDSIGSFTWKHLNGDASVGLVCAKVRDEFGTSAEPVEERVGEFVRLLRREDMVAYPAADGPAGGPRAR